METNVELGSHADNNNGTEVQMKVNVTKLLQRAGHVIETGRLLDTRLNA